MAEDRGSGREVFELRFDILAPMRSAAEMLSACRGTQAERDRCGVPAPVGMWWMRLGGRRGPGLVTLYRWPSLVERESQFGRFLDSAAAQALIWEGGADGVISASESLILRPVAGAGPVLSAAPAGAVHELRLLRVLNGALGEAAQSLLANELAAVRQVGAALTGLFEVVLGQDRPLLVVLTAWPAGVAPSDVWLALDASDGAAGRRHAERERHSRRLFLGAETILLEPLPTSESDAR